MNVPAAFYPFIIGKGGNSKKRIEKETGVIITLPQKGGEESQVLIKGPTKNSIINAHARIEIIMDTVGSFGSKTYFWLGNKISSLHSLPVHSSQLSICYRERHSF